MDEPSKLRVSDEERERAALEIRDHFAAGRLDDEELSDRLQAIYSAKTADELHTARADLPLLPATVAAQERAELAQRRAHLQRRLLQQAGGGMVLFVVGTVVWLVSGASGQFWPVWIVLLTLVSLLRNGWRLYGPAPELDRVEEDLARRERRARHGAVPGQDRLERIEARRESRHQRRKAR